MNLQAKKHQGVTLVELMIVIGVIGVLSLVGSQLTSSWVQQAKIVEAQGLFEQGIGKARAAAIKNPQAITNNNAATALCISNGLLTVKSASNATTPNCVDAGLQIWQAKLPVGLVIQDGPTPSAAAVNCILFNKNAWVIGGDNCTLFGKNTVSLRLSMGGSVFGDFTFN